MLEVLSLPAHRLMGLRQPADRLAAACTALLARGDPALALGQVPLCLAVPARIVWIIVRSASVAKDSRPRSMPVSRPVGGSGCADTSTQEIATYQPSASLEIVTVLGVPSMGRDQWTAMRPILARTSAPLSSRAPLPYSLNVKEWERLP